MVSPSIVNGFRTRLHRTHGIIPALDLPSIDQIRKVVAATAVVDGIVGFKLGPIAVFELGLRRAVESIRELTDLPIIYDHQKAGLDIPSNAAVFAKAVASAGVSAAIIFPVAGPTAAAAFISALVDNGVTPLVGGALPIVDYGISSGGWVSDSLLADLTRTTLASGQRNLIVPAGPALREISAIAASSNVRPTLFVPGISPSGSELATLSGLVAASDGLYPIVGRAVFAAPDPASAAAFLVAKLNEAIVGSSVSAAPLSRHSDTRFH